MHAQTCLLNACTATFWTSNMKCMPSVQCTLLPQTLQIMKLWLFNIGGNSNSAHPPSDINIWFKTSTSPFLHCRPATIWVSSYRVYPRRCFQKDYECNILLCPDCQHLPQFPSPAYLVPTLNIMHHLNIKPASFQLLSLPLEVFSEGLQMQHITLLWLPAPTLGFCLKLTLHLFYILHLDLEGGILVFIAYEGVSLPLTLYLFILHLAICGFISCCPPSD